MTILCKKDDLVPNSGVCALVEQNGESHQVAIFYLPQTDKKVYAIGNWDPAGGANVLSRGIAGNLGDDVVVASPLYKQHFSLTSGECIEEDLSVPVYNVCLEDEQVILAG